MRDSTIYVWKEAAPSCSQGGGLGGWDISLSELPTQRDKETKTEGNVFFLNLTVFCVLSSFHMICAFEYKDKM